MLHCLVALSLALLTPQGLQGPHSEFCILLGGLSPFPSVFSFHHKNCLRMELDCCITHYLELAGICGHHLASELRTSGLWPACTCILILMYFWCPYPVSPEVFLSICNTSLPFPTDKFANRSHASHISGPLGHRSSFVPR